MMRTDKRPTAKRAELPSYLTAASALLLLLVLPGAARAQWATSGNNISSTNTGNVGVGTTTPSTKLDVAGVTKSDGFNLINTAAEKSFVVLWNNGVANQKVQVYWPASTQVDGIYEITVTGHYWYSNSNGGIRKRIVINGRNIGIINMEQSEVPFRLGFTGNSDTISDIMWDSANSRYYFIVSNLDNAQNGITIHVKSITPAQTASNADTLNVTPIYTTDATVYPQLQTSIMGSNVGIGTNTPGYKLDVQGGQINASGGFCIAGDCKTSWSQVAGGNGGTQWTTAGTSVYYNSGNVGVGTASPVRPFHVDLGSLTSNGTRIGRAAAANSPYFDFTLDTTGTPYGFISAGDNLAYRNIAIAPFGGNVGIGTTSPTTKLEVAGFGKFEANGAGVGVRNLNGWTQMYVTRTGSYQAAFIATPSVAYSASNPYWAMGLSADGSAGWSLDTWDGASLITRMRMLPTGDIGIGTAAPASARLHLYSPSNTYLRIGAPLANQSSIAFNDDSYGQDIVLYRPESTRDFVVWTATAGNAMRVMQTGSVGVGTNTPGYKFDVQGGQVNASGGLCIAGDCKTAWSQVGGSGQWTASGSNIYFNTGNVGVGTTTPGAKLHVNGTTLSGISAGTAGDYNGRSLMLTARPLNDGVASLGFDANSTYRGAFDFNGGSGLLVWYANGGSGWSPNFALTAGGNVGVGTTTPSAKLHIISADDTVAPALSIRQDSNPLYGFDFNLDTNVNGNLSVNRVNNGASANVMTFDRAGGNIGIGTASPAAKLDVNGNVSVTGDITATGNIAAKYQDVAEWVPSTQKLSAGTVVVLDTTRTNHVLASTSSYDTAVAGVVSARPGIALGEGGEGKLLVATTGRVRVRVDATLGPIKVGDLLVTSDREGVAMKSEPVVVGGRKMHAPGTIIGKALEPLASGTGEILVLLSLQ